MLRVMVVDDALYMRITYRNMLEGSGAEIVAEAENGEQAVDMYEETKPDVVLLDLTMPGMSGQEALRHIMQMDRGARVVVVSAMGQETFIKECLQLGAKSFMIKPFKEKALLNVLGL